VRGAILAILSDVSEQNPLLGFRLPIPFDEVRPEHVKPAIAILLEQARERIDQIAQDPAPRTYANTLAALDSASEPLDLAVSVVRHLEGVVTTPELREAWNEVQPEVSAFYSTIPLHAGLWEALKAFASTEEAKQLQGVRARFLHKTMDAFRRHGADLDAEGKKQLEALDVELATITTKFGQNVLDATAGFEYYIEDESALAGLPPSAIAAARQAAEAKGKSGWRFSLQAPSYVAIVTYLEDAKVRELFYRAYGRRAAEANTALIAKILELRQRKANLLGFQTFADFNLVDRMAKTATAARSFVDSLRKETESAFHRENEALRIYSGKPALNPWDVAFYSERQRCTQYAFEEEDLRPYFPLEQVVNGMFDLVHRLYGVSVVEGPAVPVWHEEVKYYEIRDEDGTLLSTFYADWFPRDSKRGGAWMDAFLTGTYKQGEWRPHIGLMCGNLTPPIGGKPALLTHREVETIFHEFGHLLHHSLSRVEVKSLAGTNVAWDFVELPSQIMENWCWEREALDLFARHWQTNEPIPEELLQKMRAARTFRAGNAQMRQLGFATIDLSLHTEYSPDTHGDPVLFSNKLLAAFAPAPLPADYAMLAGFTHLFADPTGYGAGYYSYKWAEVLDADAFTRFKHEGIFNRETGRAFRDCILSQGDSRDPAELFRSFLGRDPDPAALMERLGLQ
jgi:oligopeptidase A